MGSLDSQPSRSLRNQRCYWSFVMDVVFESPGLTYMQMAMIWLYLWKFGYEKIHKILSFWVLQPSFMLVPRGPHPLHAPTLQASGLDEGAHQQKHRRLLRATGAIAFVFENLLLILGLSSLCLYRNTGPVFGAPSWTCPAPGSSGPKCFFEDNLCFAKKKCFLKDCKL